MEKMVAEGSKVFYIHGLYGSRNSKKYSFIKQKYSDSFCFEWKFNENIELFLENTFNFLNKIEEPITLIGSSVGGNFAWQIQQQLIEKGKNCDLILINPLVELLYKHEDNFPQHLVKYLKPMNHFENTKVILSLQDEVIDTNQSRAHFEIYDYNNPDKIEIMFVDDDHRISKFEELMIKF